jgi:hypothetical protein
MMSIGSLMLVAPPTVEAATEEQNDQTMDRTKGEKEKKEKKEGGERVMSLSEILSSLKFWSLLVILFADVTPM